MENICHSCNFDDNKNSIKILSSDDILIDKIKKILKCEGLKIESISCYDEQKNIENFKNVNVILIDLSTCVKYEEIFNFLRSEKDSLIPILFFSENFKVIKELLNKLKVCWIYDFIHRDFLNEELINRIHLLITVSKTNQNLKNEKNKVIETLYNIFNYSEWYILILDKEMNIKFCNLYLAKTLRNDNIEKLIEKNWLDFIPKNKRETIKHIHNDILNDGKLFLENINEIKHKNNKTFFIKWFNTKINHGINWIFSIGFPFYENQLTESNDINCIRNKFKELIETDRTTIQLMQEKILKIKK